MRSLPLDLVLSATLLAMVSSAVANPSDPPVFRAPLKESHLRESTAYFEVFITGTKVGWMRQSIAPERFGGEEVIAVEVEFLQKLLNRGEAITSESRDVEYFSAQPPYRLIAASSRSRQKGFESETWIRRSREDGSSFIAEVHSGGVERAREIGPLDYTLGDSLAAVVWFERGPQVGSAVRLRELDLSELEVRTALHTLRRVLPETGDGALEALGLTGRYEIDYFDALGKTRARLITDARGQLLWGKLGGSVELRLARPADALQLEAKLDLFESSLIRVGQRLGDPTEIRALELEITGESIGLITDGPDQAAELDAANGRLLLKVGREHGKRIPVSAGERVESLRETSAYPTGDPQVMALVQRAIRGATRPKARIKRLVDFVDGFIIDDASSEPLTVHDIIDTRRGDCTEHSQLFVTMARAAGIPAREVSGFIYGESLEASFGGHAWCEVEVDGFWHSVDPSWGETMINATHIRISSDRPSTEEMDLYMGGLRFRVLSVSGRDGKQRLLGRTRGEP